MQILQIVTHFIIQYQKLHLLIAPPISLEKSLNIGKVASHGDEYSFQNPNSHLKI